MLKVFVDINKINKKWDKIDLPFFLKFNFLQIFYKTHTDISHIFAIYDNTRLYGHIFKIKFRKAKNYLSKNSIFNLILSFINFDVLYLTNSFITNVPAFTSKQSINLKELLKNIRKNYSIVVIPDFLYNKLIIEDNSYKKVEVEEEMVLNIKSEWNTLVDYTSDLKMKYRNKVKKIMKQTSEIEIRKLNVTDLEKHAIKIKKLFNQVAKSSQFSGPIFNTGSFIHFVKQKFMKIDGYFINDKLVGFSSIIEKEEKLYSYFVGFDKTLNKSVPIYGRILIENIKSAIERRKKLLILGRTANEYKSNFGALPIKSYVYLKIKNTFLRTVLNPVFSKIKIKKWEQRRPFKINA